jgi:hypothetical protein
MAAVGSEPRLRPIFPELTVKIVLPGDGVFKNPVSRERQDPVPVRGSVGTELAIYRAGKYGSAARLRNARRHQWPVPIMYIKVRLKTDHPRRKSPFILIQKRADNRQLELNA